MSIDLRDAAFSKEVPVALYYQLKESLLQKIPTERELCEMYGVSRITVRKALDDLQNEDYLYRIQGKGTYVKRSSIDYRLSKFYSFNEELSRRGLKERAQMLSFSKVVPEDKVRAQLHLAEGQEVFCVKRTRYMDETPYVIEISYIPSSLCPGLCREEIETEGLYSSMRRHGVHPDHATEQFRATGLTGAEAKLLSLSPGEPAINLRRITWAGNTLVEYCNSIVRGDFFTYTVELK